MLHVLRAVTGAIALDETLDVSALSDDVVSLGEGDDQDDQILYNQATGAQQSKPSGNLFVENESKYNMHRF